MGTDLVFHPEHAGRSVGAAETRRRVSADEALLSRALRGESWNEAGFGWFRVAESASAALLSQILAEAAYVRERAGTMVVIGIGGSNRGAMAAIRALRRSTRSPTRIVWAGDTMSAAKLKDVLDIVDRESVVLNVIAKDFNTVEPGIAFRVLRQAMMRKYGPEYGGRIVAIGSRGPGQLFELSLEHGYRFLDFPASIGGRFSVLSAVGLFPMAVAGIDISEILRGAADVESALKSADLHSNPAVLYAVNRNLLFSAGFTIESLVIFEPDLTPFARWWTQLFAETEGKTPDAIFPTFFCYSEDLHAVGQYVQEGRRCIAETFLALFYDNPGFAIPGPDGVRDGFDYLDGIPCDALNRSVYTAALRAHSDDGVPCQEISVPEISASSLGGLFYFFMFSCYLSACLIGVNPFVQDGVEGYKRNMYALLGKKS